MRVIALIKANADSEAGAMPEGTEPILEAMGKYNEELVKAGVMLAGEGLHPSSKGARFALRRRPPHGDRRSLRRNQGADRRLLDLEDQVPGRGDRVGQEMPQPSGAEGQIELRPIFELEDFGEVLTPELREQEERQRAEIARQHGS